MANIDPIEPLRPEPLGPELPDLVSKEAEKPKFESHKVATKIEIPNPQNNQLNPNQKGTYHQFNQQGQLPFGQIGDINKGNEGFQQQQPGFGQQFTFGQQQQSGFGQHQKTIHTKDDKKEENDIVFGINNKDNAQDQFQNQSMNTNIGFSQNMYGQNQGFPQTQGFGQNQFGNTQGFPQTQEFGQSQSFVDPPQNQQFPINQFNQNQLYPQNQYGYNQGFNQAPGNCQTNQFYPQPQPQSQFQSGYYPQNTFNNQY